MNSLGDRLYRLALLAFPASFRRRHGAAMAAHFAAQRAALGGRPIARVGLWIRAVRDAVVHGVGLRMDSRGMGGDAMLSDVRTAARMLWRSPGYVAVVVVTLGLGIGGVTAVFTLADPMIFRPLPWTDADRLVEVRARYGESTALRLHADDFVLIEREVTSFLAVATLNGPYLGQFRDSPETLLGNGVSKGFFPLTGLRPVIGRLFTEDEYDRDEDATPVVAMLTYGFWQGAFGGDPGVIGRRLELGGRQPWAMEIVGVLPPEFFFPQAVNRAPSFIVPGAMNRRYLGRANVYPTILARVRQDVTFTQAEAEVDRALAAVERANPAFEQGRRARLIPLQTLLFQSLRTPLFLLFIATACLLMLAWVNLTHLAQARAAMRARELAVRVALGAARWRVVRLLTVEAGLLAILSAAAGLAVGQALFVWGFARTPEYSHVYRLLPATVDGRVLVFAVLLSSAALFALGLWPALRSVRADLRHVLAGLPGRRRGWRIGAESVAIVGQTAFAVGLVVTCLLVVRSFVGLVTLNRGFDPAGVQMAGVDVREEDPTAAFEARRRIVDVLNRTPGVTAAAVATGVPALTLNEGVLGPDGKAFEAVVAFQGSAGFATALGMTLETGRMITAEEAWAGAPVALVDRGAADIMWPGESPVGKTLRVTSGRDLAVVGVLGRARTSLNNPDDPRGTVLAAPDVTTETARRNLDMLLLRLDGRRPASAAVLADAVSRAAPGARWNGTAGLTSWSRYTGQPRFLASALGLLGALTIALAAFGILGVVSHLVARRTREIGIRMALGADRLRVRALVLRQALGPALIGVSAGLLLAFWWSESVRAVLVGVSARDPWSFAGAAVVTLATVVVASLRPAMRASRVDPVRTLRAE